jgi:hypothetical protein
MQRFSGDGDWKTHILIELKEKLVRSAHRVPVLDCNLKAEEILRDFSIRYYTGHLEKDPTHLVVEKL